MLKRMTVKKISIATILLFICFLFIQLISYRVFNFNLYKTIMNTLFKEVR